MSSSRLHILRWSPAEWFSQALRRLTFLQPGQRFRQYPVLRRAPSREQPSHPVPRRPKPPPQHQCLKVPWRIRPSPGVLTPPPAPRSQNSVPSPPLRATVSPRKRPVLEHPVSHVAEKCIRVKIQFFRCALSQLMKMHYVVLYNVGYHFL